MIYAKARLQPMLRDKVTMASVMAMRSTFARENTSMTTTLALSKKMNTTKTQLLLVLLGTQIEASIVGRDAEAEKGQKRGFQI
ncbi:hypothetical protein Fmac_016751 [Flemingia macrophylla]|uniref:Uncharacterized protein n=1 Tax=Flemingia macrophylla TaxID=520843 RepID=A0ABD1MJ46_9FABA